jgi:hypothetical protein
LARRGSPGAASFFLQINIAEIEIHKTDQPDAVVDLLDTDGLARKGYAEVDLLVIEAKTPSVITLIRSSRLRLRLPPGVRQTVKR